MALQSAHRWLCGLTITDPADVDVYEDAFSRLRRLAVTGNAARVLLQQVLADLMVDSGG